MSNLAVVYYWYDHLIRDYEWGREAIKAVESALHTHNYKEFMQLRKKLNSIQRGLVFLPKEAFVYDRDDVSHDSLFTLDITVKENFMRITDSEFECG